MSSLCHAADFKVMGLHFVKGTACQQYGPRRSVWQNDGRKLTLVGDFTSRNSVIQQTFVGLPSAGPEVGAQKLVGGRGRSLPLENLQQGQSSVPQLSTATGEAL